MVNEKEKDIINQEDTFFDGIDIEPADGSVEELSDINLEELLSNDFLEASDNVEMPSLDAFDEVADTSEIDALLEEDNSSLSDDSNMIDLNNLDFEGLDLDNFNVDDLDLDNMSLDDLMAEDTDASGETQADTEGLDIDELADIMNSLDIEDGEAETIAEPDMEAAPDTAKKQANVFSEALSVLSSEQDEEEEADEAEVPLEEVEALLDNVRAVSKKKKKKKAGYKNLFANIVDDKEIEKSENRKKKELELEKEKAEKEEKKKLAEEEKAKKKEQRKLDKERLKEEKKEAKALKKQAKKEARELRELEEETEIEGRINKVGAIIVFVVIGMMAVFIFVGTRLFSYSNSISNAKTYYEKGQYAQSYNELAGLDLKEKDKILYQKVVTIMYVYRQLDAYETYYREERYPQALDSLLKGIREYEKYMPDAIELEIADDMDKIKSDIVAELSAEYGITEEMAREINQITDSTEYSKRVYDLAQNLASYYF